MKYKNVINGIFINRPNRFIAQVEIDGKVETVHVKNTGRCKELLIPGTSVYLAKADNPERKTAYDLIGVEKQRDGKPPLSVNIDSQAANDAAAEWLKKGLLFPKDAQIRREIRYGNSRFDFCIKYNDKTAFLEVKGVTLEKDGIAFFPDAPTERGVKHVNELTDCATNGYEAYILFVVQMKDVYALRPNDETDKAFGDALRKAHRAGVKILAADCKITASTIDIENMLPVKL